MQRWMDHMGFFASAGTDPGQRDETRRSGTLTRHVLLTHDGAIAIIGLWWTRFE